MFKEYDDLVREMEQEMQRLANQAFAGLVKLSEGPESLWRPRVDVYETAEELLVLAEMAGLEQGHYTIELADDGTFVRIHGRRTEAPGSCLGRQRCHQIEIYYGSFDRSISLPPTFEIDRDRIEATYSNGMLRISLPRRSPSEQGRIPIDDEA